jgi:hypothetical protein
MGERVAYNDLKPGDLLFFHTVRGHRISHVAIYEGNGKFIHASSGGGHVQESALSGYYSKRLVKATRILKRKSRARHYSEESAASASSHESTPKSASPKDDAAPSMDNN